MAQASTKKSNDTKAAMQAVDKALARFDMPTAAMAVSAVAGVYAAQGKSEMNRFAGLGANVETMTSAFNETMAFYGERKKSVAPARERSS